MATRKQATKKAVKKAGRGKKASGNPFAKGGRFYKGDDDGEKKSGKKTGNPFKNKVRGK